MKRAGAIERRARGGWSRAASCWDHGRKLNWSVSCLRSDATWCTVFRYIVTRAPIDPNAAALTALAAHLETKSINQSIDQSKTYQSEFKNILTAQ